MLGDGGIVVELAPDFSGQQRDVDLRRAGIARDGHEVRVDVRDDDVGEFAIADVPGPVRMRGQRVGSGPRERGGLDLEDVRGIEVRTRVGADDFRLVGPRWKTYRWYRFAQPPARILASLRLAKKPRLTFAEVSFGMEDG